MKATSITKFAGHHSARIHGLREIGGYDENYLGNVMREESDAAVRLWKAGYRITIEKAKCFQAMEIALGDHFIHLCCTGGHSEIEET